LEDCIASGFVEWLMFLHSVPLFRMLSCEYPEGVYLFNAALCPSTSHTFRR